MARRQFFAPFLLGAFLSLGASSYRTPNFTVTAATPQIAQQVGQYAEQYRREKALQWLGTEMPQLRAARRAMIWQTVTETSASFPSGM